MQPDAMNQRIRVSSKGIQCILKHGLGLQSLNLEAEVNLTTISTPFTKQSITMGLGGSKIKNTKKTLIMI